MPFKYWVPLLGLYTGARINELAQLFLVDFQAQGDVQVISINDDGEGKRLKTKASKRLVPIHPELVRLFGNLASPVAMKFAVYPVSESIKI